MKKTLLYPLLSTVIFLLSVVISPAVAQNIIFEEDFESGTLDTDRWTANAAEDGGLVEPVRQLTDVPAIPRTGNYALAMGRTTNGSASTNTLDLHLDLSGHTNVTMEFWLRSEFDNTDEDDAIFLSVDGGENFVEVLNLRPGDWGGRVYGQVVVDIGAAAAFEGLELSNQTVVRIQQRGNRGFVGNSSYYADGFFIDDVVVKGAPTYATLPFTDGFEADTLGSAWRVANPYHSDLTAPEAEAQWGFVVPVRRITDVPEIPRTGDYALAMGRSSNASSHVANAIDLHLDLSGHTNVTMEFWLRSEFDDTDEDDVIFLSDDGGMNFTEAFALEPGAREFGEYEEIVLNLDSLAQELDLDITDQFVVRIQQRGNRGFVGNSSYYADGFFIDDVRVTSSGSAVVLIPDQSFSISENAVEGTVVGSLPEADSEGNALSYVLQSQSQEGAFAVSSSGEITVADASMLDFATQPVLELEVEASNGTSSSRATITINITEGGDNENTAPAMEAQSFSIAENSGNGTLVGEISATDAEGDDISYSITDGNTEEAFTIDEVSGELLVQNSTILDYETHPEFTLTVNASDGTLSSNAIVTIVLTDVEDETPTSVADELREATLLYPNPVGEFLQLEIPEKMREGILTLYTLSGEKVQEYKLAKLKERLDLRLLATGTYIVQIRKKDIHIHFRLQKN